MLQRTAKETTHLKPKPDRHVQAHLNALMTPTYKLMAGDDLEDFKELSRTIEILPETATRPELSVPRTVLLGQVPLAKHVLRAGRLPRMSLNLGGMKRNRSLTIRAILM